ncbi:MAG: hypothetical protein GOVbin3762_11 [Prokaryotic dsDNA virus sp.]|nr:MAG: hypothetical protein GOVbin3762_11 [Prokaryotic dsDNA virus sp.]|tara:strand:+ start:945 stop:1136 length:192 start_codon:yes stop_codon:yes gene_type:complete
MDKKHRLENGKYYNPLRVKKYLEMIDSVNQQAEEKIERIRKARDEKTSFFDRCIIEERQKPEE